MRSPIPSQLTQHGLTLTQLPLFQHPEDGSWSSPLAPTPKTLVEKDLTSSEPTFSTFCCCWSPEPTTMCPLLLWVRLRSIRSSEMFAYGWIQRRERAGEVAFKPAVLAQLLVSGSTGNTSPCSPGKTCSECSEGAGSGQDALGGTPLGRCNFPFTTAGKEEEASALRMPLLPALQHWGLIWLFLEVKELSYPGLIQPWRLRYVPL